MSQDRPPSADRKLGLVAPLSIALVVLAIVVAVVLSRRETPVPPKPAPPPVTSSPTPMAKPAEPVLDRTEFLKEATAIAATYAEMGNAAPTGSDPLAGRRFRIRVPFGCDGPQATAGTAQAYYELDAKTRTARLVARPAVWSALPPIQELQDAGIEAAEGFWIPQPWRYAETCPPRREGPVPAVPTPAAAQTLGLVRLFEEGGSRIPRRGERAYEHVIKWGEADPQPGVDGFRLVLEGRFAAFPSGRVARCWNESSDHRPMCLYAIELERVAFEDAKANAIAEWRD